MQRPQTGSGWCGPMRWLVVVGIAVACTAPATPAAKPPATPPAAQAALPASQPASAAAPAQSAPAASPGKQLLDDLVGRANAERSLLVAYSSTWNPEMIQRLGDAFKKRFNLSSDLTLAPAVGTQHMPVAISETRSGLPPTYDAVYGDDTELMQLVGAGGTQRVGNWEALLAEINPLVGSGKVTPDQISFGPFSGQGFQFMGNVKQLHYNPRLIGESDLPRTHVELVDPRYKDRFVHPPWTAHFEIAPAVFDNLNREQWLDTVRAVGRNAGAVLQENVASERVVLGQYPFALSRDAGLHQIRAKDPQAPLAARFFEDYNQFIGMYSGVRTGTAHPAGATLWVLWMTTPEAEAIWQPGELWAQRYGESEVDREMQRLIRESGAKIVGFPDNRRTVELLEWYQTPDGRQYLEILSKALRGE
jgi:ABC-type Fe3+ transport system substrate-binding protein